MSSLVIDIDSRSEVSLRVKYPLTRSYHRWLFAMNSGTPAEATRVLSAEEFELPTISASHEQPEAGPSRPRRMSKPQPSVRKLTIHAGPSTSVLFSAHSPRQRRSSGGQGAQHHRSSSFPDSPTAVTPRRHARAQFLDEDIDYFGGGHARRSEEVQVPNIGHMLGFNPDDEDHYAVAAGMTSQWKKRLYLLMEEPSSGREAFYIHVGVTAGIIFR